MDAFTTPEKELHDEIVVDLHSLNNRINRIDANLRKAERVELGTLVLMCCALMFGGCLALEHTLSIQAKDRQENVAWAR
ncbi:hypothetical protein [Agrobacterium larrymoorei]|uniref:hypothetical protein n=1 Tax=Agrobacterium larrymoorei TaxID=160699 RepID=UPI0030BFC257